MADLTRVAEVLAAHRQIDSSGLVCACDPDTANFAPGWLAAHQAEMLADAGLVGGETETATAGY